jgi:hypothetical protein
VVLSNIGWDLRPVFTHHRLDHPISGYVLSYEAGTAKPAHKETTYPDDEYATIRSRRTASITSRTCSITPNIYS